MADPIYIISMGMTSNTAPSPFVTAASSEIAGVREAWMACDNDGLSQWRTNSVATGWISVDHGAVRTITGYIIEPTSTANAAPKDWTFEGSNDNSSWTTLDTQTGITSWSANQARMYTISSASYRYYRLNISANNGNASIYIAGFRFRIPTPSGGSVTSAFAFIG